MLTVAQSADRQELIRQLQGCIAYQEQQMTDARQQLEESRRQLTAAADVKSKLREQQSCFPDLTSSAFMAPPPPANVFAHQQPQHEQQHHGRYKRPVCREFRLF